MPKRKMTYTEALYQAIDLCIFYELKSVLKNRKPGAKFKALPFSRGVIVRLNADFGLNFALDNYNIRLIAAYIHKNDLLDIAERAGDRIMNFQKGDNFFTV